MFTVTPKEVDEFDRAILTACVLRSEHRMDDERSYPTDWSSIIELPDYFYHDKYLVISFDRGWYPFLDNTRGYNRGPQRWYIPKCSRILAAIADALRWNSDGRPGGRVFVSFDGVFRRDDGEQIQLLDWELPKKSHFLGSGRVTAHTLRQISGNQP